MSEGMTISELILNRKRYLGATGEGSNAFSDPSEGNDLFLTLRN
jgi:hypothetical protein